MAELVGADWVAARLENPAFTMVDPRRPMKYLSGHLPGAINLPVYKLFGADGRLPAPAALADFIGAAGLGDDSKPVLYDSPEGQNAAMLSWILEYLGHPSVRVMDAFFEAWKANGREVLYKPVEAPARPLSVRTNPAIRATLAEVHGVQGLKFVDFRSREEFIGERSLGPDTRGHIPGAVNLVWRDLASLPDLLLKPNDQIQRILDDAGLAHADKIIAYCRSGPRAALGYLAMRQLGYDVRLFDGSWAEWSAAGLPAEK
jgi:thiosulfate/3-mercaptopyruvate sulfurtransferase